MTFGIEVFRDKDLSFIACGNIECESLEKVHEAISNDCPDWDWARVSDQNGVFLKKIYREIISQ